MKSISWLGVAGLKIETDDGWILFDPYLSRHTKFETFFKPILPKARLVEGFLNNHQSIAAIFVSHTHSDHAADIPKFAQLSSAKICGSKSLGIILKTFGVAKNFLNVEDNPAISGNGWKVTAIKSKHGKALLGKEPFPGEITKFPKKPRVVRYRTGQTFNFLVEIEGLKILHLGSAELIEANLSSALEKPADIAFFCVPGWDKEEALKRFLKTAKPKVVIPFHYDDFSSELNQENIKTIPGIDLALFTSAVKKLAPETKLLKIKPLEVTTISKLIG